MGTTRVNIAGQPPPSYIGGVGTYYRDFLRVMDPRHDPDAPVALCLRMDLQTWDVSPRTERVVRILHSDATPPEKIVDLPHVYVTHYRKRLEDWTVPPGDRLVYMPMSVDDRVLPEIPKKSRDWIYFGNVFLEKSKQINMLREVLDFDIISFGMFNDSRHVMTREDALREVAKYRFGIGVGRAALEMLGLGLRVLVVGNQYGGPILSREDFESHRLANINSRLHKSGSDPVSDIKKLEKSDFYVKKSFISMRNPEIITEYQKIIEYGTAHG